MLLTLLILRKMILGGNLSFARLSVVDTKDASWVPELAMRLGGSVLSLFA
jgi:hypothetical protein